MPTLDWIGKDKVINHHQDVPYRVLERQYSYDSDGQHSEDNGSENMIIHGDNLEALKSLLPRYEGQVKCIYIDPPYNTGNEGWVYNDNVSDPKIRKWLGEVVGKEGEDLSRHDKWLCMMYPRLKLLQKLLRDDGVIFISIDDNELFNLKMICDEIFGTSCFVAKITWQNNYSLRNDAKGIPYETDNILVYSKNLLWNPQRLSRTAEMDARYVNYDNDTTAYKVTPIHAPGAENHKGMVYAIQHPITGELMYPPKGRHWKDGQDKLLSALREWAPYNLTVINDIDKRSEICGSSVPDNIPAIMLSVPLNEAQKIAKKRYNTPPWPNYFFLAKGLGSIQTKTYLDSSKGKVVSTLWKYDEVGTNVEATNEIKPLLQDTLQFDTPKPCRLIERILQIATFPDDIILDSFAGSGTTAHAVLNMNKADGGNRKFILVELGDYADTITAERVKRVIQGYGSGKNKTEGTGGNFSYYELGEPLFIGDILNESVGTDKIREYIWYTETRQSHEPVSDGHLYFLGNYNRTAYYFYYEPDRICSLDYAFLATISARADNYIIYADRCALSSEELLRFGITFKKIPRDIARL
ncbi:MAG: site-specific DNA-methyltransferase [Lachnospiraceae bacterium]|nr:site-specific DNA-methyltransferase [Lachnospiraceae bacterium]